MKFSIGYFAKPRAAGVPPALLATYLGDFDSVNDAKKAAIAEVDNLKIGTADSITIDPIGERWLKGECLVRIDNGWERAPEPERTKKAALMLKKRREPRQNLKELLVVQEKIEDDR